jgi:acyl CoA:acetate/3-ketoacid CoA transferase alpha subunit/acyl CoA:acetate/3-ketoacid CoA transferase beta subunit
MSKVTSLAYALRMWVEPGDHVHLAYNEARPNAMVLGLARRFQDMRPNLTLSTGGLVSAQAVVISEHLASHVIGSFIGDNYPNAAPNPTFQSAVASGEVALEETTLWTLVARLKAGALGVPFFPVRSLAGTDLRHQGWVDTVEDPFGQGPVTVVQALNPDITLLHGVAADEDGNVVLSPPVGEGAWGALAARKGVIASVEAVVDRQTIRRHQSLVQIPAHRVVAVCEVPFGAHPYGLYSPIPEVAGYVEDEDFILEQRRTCRDADEQRRWVDAWVRGTESHRDYLDLVGRTRLDALIGRGAVGTSRLDRLDVDSRPATASERMVLQAAEVISGMVRNNGLDVIMTGIGFAHLAAWLAYDALAQSGAFVPLMAEIGAYGYEPQPGDPFIFSHRNLSTCSWMADVSAILGAAHGNRANKTIAALGAGEIDAAGNMNSSRTAEGGFLVGSGGANDITSGANAIVVVVKHGRHRLVDRVPFVTCSGARVRVIVTDQAVLRRDEPAGEFVLTSVLVPESGTVENAVRKAVDGCGWQLSVGREVSAFSPPNAQTLTRLRSFDPRHAFLPAPTETPVLQ